MNGELTEEDVRVIVDDIPAGRIGKPRDVANVVRFLSGEEQITFTGRSSELTGAGYRSLSVTAILRCNL